MGRILAVLVFAIISIAQGHNDVQIVSAEEHVRKLNTKDLQKSIDCVQNLLRSGNADIGLPPFDPLTLSDYTIDLATLQIPFIEGNLRLKNFKADGFANWNSKDVKLNTILIETTLHFTLEWPSTTITGDYEIDASFLGIPIKGEGKLIGSSEIGTIELGLKLFTIAISKLTLNFGLSSAQLKFDEFKVGPIDKTKELNESIEIIIKWTLDHLDEISQNLSKYILQAIKKSNVRTYGLPEIITEFKKCNKIL